MDFEDSICELQSINSTSLHNFDFVIFAIVIRQLNVLQYNSLNRTFTYYFEIRQAISQLVCQGPLTKIFNINLIG